MHSPTGPLRLLRERFSVRLVAFSTAIVCLTIGSSSALVYVRAKVELERGLADELLAVARSTASLVDADLLELIYHEPDGSLAFPDEFELLRHQLDRVRRANQLPDRGNPIYIMRPAPDYEQTGSLEFVVMPDRNEHGEYFVGNRYVAQEHNRRALAGESAASGVYGDAEGVWISASAPLRDSRGAIVGLVQVDRPVDFFYAAARSQALDILWGALASMLAGVALAAVFARGLVMPIRAIAAAISALERGDRSRRVVVDRRDEIGALARGFNRMAETLEEHTGQLEQARIAAEESSHAKSELIANMNTVNRVLHALGEASSVDDATDRVLDAVCDCYGWQAGSYWARFEDAYLRVQAQTRNTRAVLRDANRGASLRSGIGLPGQAWARRDVVFACPDADEVDRALTRAVREAGVTSGVAVPVIVSGAVAGVLEFFADEESSVSIAMRDTMRTISQLLGSTHERLLDVRARAAAAADAASVDRVVRAMAEVDDEEAVVHSALAAVRQSFGWAYGAYWSVVRGGRAACRAVEVEGGGADPPQLRQAGERGAGLVGRAWREHELVHVEDLDALHDSPREAAALELGWKSGLAIPLRLGEGVDGVLEFLDDSPMALTRSRRDALGSIARLVVGAVTRVRAAATRERAGIEASRVMASVARGNLRERVSGQFSSEFEVLQSSINSSIERLSLMVREIRDAAATLSTAAGEIQTGNADLSQRTKGQSIALQECAQALDGLAGAVRRSADSSQQASRQAVDTKTLARRGGEVVAAAVTAMGRIEGSSRRIGDVVGVIDGIAERTNLLALNAAIEAARSGELGRGFAVVATEIRDLAGRSALAAQEVRDLVRESVAAVQEGVESVRHSGGTLENIVQAAAATSEAISEIAASTESQATGLSDVGDVVGRLDELTRQNSALVEQVAAASAAMTDLATELASQVASFQLGGAAPDAPPSE